MYGERDWIVDFSDSHDPKYGEPHKVPLVVATEENFKKYGTIVKDFDAEKIEIVPWPVSGRRPLHPGTGIFGGIIEGDFVHEWVGDRCRAVNTGLGWGVSSDYFIACLPKGADPQNRTSVLVREASYHPDGSQAFFPKENTPYVSMLALPGDEVKPEDFVAFYSDGSFGIHIFPNIWHLPMIPLTEKAVFRNKQGAVHGCVNFDSVKECGKFLSIPLVLDGMP